MCVWCVCVCGGGGMGSDREDDQIIVSFPG